MKLPHNKRFVRMLIFGLIFGVLVSSCHSKKDEKQSAPAFELTDTMLASTKLYKVSQQTLKNELNFYGKITAENNKLIEVYPIVGGNVTKVYVELGDHVQKGQLLATIKSTEVAGYERDLEDANNDLVVAKKNLKVTQELFDGKLNTEKDIIEAKSNYDKALSQLRREQENYKVYNLKKGAIYEVRAPISGFIVQKQITDDMQLRSDRSDNIFDIAEISEVWAVANVNESDIGQVKLGVDASVTTLSYPDKKFYGKVDKIFNVIDPDTKAMKIIIRLANTGFLLKPEMRASINLSYEERKKLIAVPADAIVFDKNKNFVMVFKDRKHIETRIVEVYRQVDGIAYILSGLNEGEQVMVQNQLLVYNALNN